MTHEAKVSALTKLSSTPAALIIADTDEADAPYQPFWSPPAEMPTVTITKKDSDAIHDAIRDAEGEDVYLTVTHSGIVLSSSNPTASEFSAWGVTPRPAPQARGRRTRRQHLLLGARRHLRVHVRHVDGDPAGRGHRRPRAPARQRGPGLRPHVGCRQDCGRHQPHDGHRPPAAGRRSEQRHLLLPASRRRRSGGRGRGHGLVRVPDRGGSCQPFAPQG